MVKIDDKLYFTVGDISAVIMKQPNTIRGWSKYSDELEQKAIERGEDGEKARLIPKAVRVNGRRLYSWEQVLVIKRFSENMERGTLSEYSRTRNGKKGNEIQESVKVKKEKAELESIRKLLNKAQRGNGSIGIGSW
jgi:hypothetical protein